MNEDNNHKESAERVFWTITEEQRITAEKLDVLADAAQKWEAIKNVYQTDFPREDNIGEFSPIVGQTIFSADKSVADIIRGQLDHAMILSLASSGDAAMSALISANAASAIPLKPVLMNELVRGTDDYHNKSRDKITDFLRNVKPALIDSYNGAWKHFNSKLTDSERSASALMREVVDQVLKILAPGFKHRPQRIEYIANNMGIRKDSKNIIMAIVDSYQKTYRFLSKIHVPSKLDRGQLKGFLYQAEDLLIVLADNVDLLKRPK